MYIELVCIFERATDVERVKNGEEVMGSFKAL